MATAAGDGIGGGAATDGGATAGGRSIESAPNPPGPASSGKRGTPGAPAIGLYRWARVTSQPNGAPASVPSIASQWVGLNAGQPTMT